MMKKMKELKDIDRKVIMCQIESVRNRYEEDKRKEAKLTVIENAIQVVDKNKKQLGKYRSMSSLEKNRIALNMITNCRKNDKKYMYAKDQAIKRNLIH